MWNQAWERHRQRQRSGCWRALKGVHTASMYLSPGCGPPLKKERVDRQIVMSAALGHARRACTTHKKGLAGWRLPQQRRGLEYRIRVKNPGSNPMIGTPAHDGNDKAGQGYCGYSVNDQNVLVVDSNWSRRSWWSQRSKCSSGMKSTNTSALPICLSASLLRCAQWNEPCQ